MQDGLPALSKDPWKNAVPLLHDLSTTQLQHFLSTHQPPSDDGTHCSDDRSTLLAAVTACIRCRGTLREAVHGLACMALLLRIDALVRRELPTADMIPSAQQLEKSVLLKGAQDSRNKSDSEMAASSNSGDGEEEPGTSPAIDCAMFCLANQLINSGQWLIPSPFLYQCLPRARNDGIGGKGHVQSPLCKVHCTAQWFESSLAAQSRISASTLLSGSVVRYL